MAHLSPQEKLIVNLLDDGAWHCPTKELFMKDDRARISSLRKKGYVIGDKLCDGSCGMNHYSRPKMRRLEGKPPLNNYQLMHLAKQAETEANRY